MTPKLLLGPLTPACPDLDMSQAHYHNVGDQLVIPQTGDIWENLFQLAYDMLGHFGMDKSYVTLRDAYYWLNMCTDLEKSYIP